MVPGVLLWGAAVGVQDSHRQSSRRRFGAPRMPRHRLRLFAAVQGAGTLLGGVTAGALYEQSVTALMVGIAGSASHRPRAPRRHVPQDWLSPLLDVRPRR